MLRMGSVMTRKYGIWECVADGRAPNGNPMSCRIMLDLASFPPQKRPPPFNRQPFRPFNRQRRDRAGWPLALRVDRGRRAEDRLGQSGRPGRDWSAERGATSRGRRAKAQARFRVWVGVSVHEVDEYSKKLVVMNSRPEAPKRTDCLIPSCKPLRPSLMVFPNN